MKKAPKYTESFNAWRSNKAAIESAQLKTAIEISDYIERASFDNIKADLQDNHSPRFEEFNHYEKRSMGTLAFARLAVFEYLESSSSTEEERQVIIKIIQSIESLYENPYNNTKENVERLVKEFGRWINEFADKNPNKREVKEACKAIYAVLKIIDITMTSIPSWIKFAARTAGINIDELQEKIRELINTTEEKNKILERQTQLLSLQDSSSPKSLLDSLYAIDLQIINDSSISMLERIETVRERTERIPDDLWSLKAAIDSEQMLLKQKENAELLLQALKQNNQKVTGRLYILEFINKNRKKFDDVITATDNTEDKRDLLKKKEELAQPSLYRKAVSSMQYSTSLLTSIPASVFRYATPKFAQKISSYLPDTIDSETKIKLEIVINTHLEKISDELKTVRERIKDESEKVTCGDKTVEQVIQNCELEELINAAQVLSTSKSDTIQTLVQYKELCRIVENGKRVLMLAANYEGELEALIKKHDGFMVKLSNFLAQFFSVCKSETAKTLDCAGELKENIQNFKLEYGSTIQEAQQKIESSTHIPERIKAAVIEQLNIAVEVKPTSKITDKLEYLSAKKHYELVEKGFFCLKKVAISSAKPSQKQTADILALQVAPAV